MGLLCKCRLTDNTNSVIAQAKMQFMQQIVQGNPKYQEALQGDERFQSLLENYGKNLQQSVSQ